VQIWDGMSGPGLATRPGRPDVPAGGRSESRSRSRRTLVLVACASIAIAGTVLGLTLQHSKPASAPACTVVSATAGTYSLSPEQAQNAAIIAAVAFSKGLPDHAVTVALATSLQESELRNLPYGDRDSVGLFQQRPSQGWGTRSQLLDPVYSTSAFYARLTQIPGWQTMPVTDAAQAVQRSADAGAYAAWDDEARALAVALTGEVPAGFSCRLAGFGGAAPAPTALGQALSNEMGSDLLGTQVATKTGWRVAAWVVAHAYNYHVRSAAFAGMSWQAGSGRWSRDPNQPAPQTVTVQTSS
jgi:hypothetical protein